MSYISFNTSVNLKGTTMLFNRTPWCSVMELLDDKFRQQTPMSVLFSTPDATPQYCHNLMWLTNPVASAGCANRPLPRGVGSFKLQLQSAKQMLYLPRLIFGRSCNLKGMKRIFSISLLLCTEITELGIPLTNPDADVVSYIF